jgi:hypothetical protein
MLRRTLHAANIRAQEAIDPIAASHAFEEAGDRW